MVEILNAKITKPKIYIEDHGCLTFSFLLEMSDGSACMFGGWCIGTISDFKATASGLEAIMHIMDVIGVDCWEDLDNKYCRVKSDGLGSTIHEIGNLMRDEWFDVAKFFKDYKEAHNNDRQNV